MERQGDFIQLLREEGYTFDHLQSEQANSSSSQHEMITKGTTVLACKYQNGVIVAGDRRATAGTTVMYDRTDKVLGT